MTAGTRASEIETRIRTGFFPRVTRIRGSNTREYPSTRGYLENGGYLWVTHKLTSVEVDLLKQCMMYLSTNASEPFKVHQHHGEQVEQRLNNVWSL